MAFEAASTESLQQTLNELASAVTTLPADQYGAKIVGLVYRLQDNVQHCNERDLRDTLSRLIVAIETALAIDPWVRVQEIVQTMQQQLVDNDESRSTDR